MSRRRDIARALEAAVQAELGPDAHVGPINFGDAHRRMLLYNRRHERALRRSRRNQPPRAKR